VAESSSGAARLSSSRRELWLYATLAATILPIIVGVLAAPSAHAPATPALVWLLFVGSSAHVASTAWFATVPEVRAHMRIHRTRYVAVPAALVVITAVTAALLDDRHTTWLLLGFFAWQFLHFQKQNLGIAALAARSQQAAPLSLVERRALVAAGIGGVAGLVGHSRLLQLEGVGQMRALFYAGAMTFAVACVTGLAALARRAAADRPIGVAVVYLLSLLFFLPVWLFTSPYAAVAGLTIAHGLQYLLLMGLVAGAPTPARSGTLGLAILVNIALVAGLVLNLLSHLHGTTTVGRALFGAYLGLVMTHFVVDAGLWRLRDEFPRTFLTSRLPFLLDPATH
jgi:hypothetical protein